MTIQPIESREQTGLEMEALMRRMAREMRICAAIADDCQDALAEGDVYQAIDPAVVMRLQSLDLLSQQLIELGRVLDGVAGRTEPVAVCPSLLDEVRLSDLKRRLHGVEIEPEAPSPADVWID